MAKALVEFVLGSLGGLAFCSAKGGWHGIPAVGKVDSMLALDRKFLVGLQARSRKQRCRTDLAQP